MIDRQATSATHRRAFTMLELLVVVTILGLLIAILLPAIQAARESSRRAGCQHHLRQIGLAAILHDSARGTFPVGARTGGNTGFSFLVDCLPFLEESPLHDGLDRANIASGGGAFATLGHNLDQVDRLVIDVYRCPSSPLPVLQPYLGRQVMMTSYVGIAGAANSDGFVETRVNECCSPRTDGQVSAGGMLIANQGVSRRQITDGTTKTLLVSEISDYAQRKSGIKVRLDSGHPHGWFEGTIGEGTPPDFCPGLTLKHPCYSLTTVRYPLNWRDPDVPGVWSGTGPNRPFLSPHPNGVHAVFVDGSVRFLEDDLDLTILKRLATRDDGQG